MTKMYYIAYYPFLHYGWLDVWVGQLVDWMDRQIDRCLGEWVNRQTDGQMAASQVDGWMDGKQDGWMDGLEGWLDGQMVGRM